MLYLTHIHIHSYAMILMVVSMNLKNLKEMAPGLYAMLILLSEDGKDGNPKGLSEKQLEFLKELGTPEKVITAILSN